MIHIYCKAHHEKKDRCLCAECEELNNYALQKLSVCPFGEKKPTCQKCSIHCYKTQMKAQMKIIMRFAGPKMIFKHPKLALIHLLKSLR